MVDFSTKIKKLRLERNMTQSQLAERLGISKAMISAYETDIRFPSHDILIRLARIFHVSVDYLLCLEEERRINVDGLSEKQIELIANLVEEFRSTTKK